MYCLLLLWCCNDRMEWLQDRRKFGMQSLRYLLSCPLQKKKKKLPTPVLDHHFFLWCFFYGCLLQWINRMHWIRAWILESQAGFVSQHQHSATGPNLKVPGLTFLMCRMGFNTAQKLGDGIHLFITGGMGAIVRFLWLQILQIIIICLHTYSTFSWRGAFTKKFLWSSHLPRIVSQPRQILVPRFF